MGTHAVTMARAGRRRRGHPTPPMTAASRWAGLGTLLRDVRMGLQILGLRVGFALRSRLAVLRSQEPCPRCIEEVA